MYQSDAPDQILAANAGSLHGRTDQRAAGQPDAPGRTDDGEPESERDAEIGKAVGTHVCQHFSPPGIAEFRATNG